MQSLWTPKELAGFLGIRESTVSEWTRQGIIPCVVLKVGERRRVVRFRLAEIEEWLDSTRSAALGFLKRERAK